MAKYDGLIIPRSYSEYINKTDAATHAQAHQLSGVLDPAPAENSQNAVKSGGVFTALAGKQPTLTFDNVPTDGSNNPVKSNGIYDALAGKQDTLTFDNEPTENSDNPVKSGGIYTATANATPKYKDITVSTLDNLYLNWYYGVGATNIPSGHHILALSVIGSYSNSPSFVTLLSKNEETVEVFSNQPNEAIDVRIAYI